MPFLYKHFLNLQRPGHPGQPDAQVRRALHRIQDRRWGIGSIDFGAITPIPTWATASDVEQREWTKAHWGVAGNTVDPESSARAYDGGSAIEFDTMDSDVRELMRKLSLMLREDRIVVDYLWASSDVGMDCGMLQYRDGELIYEHLPEPGSTGAYELSFDIFGTRASDYGLVLDSSSGSYRYAGTKDGDPGQGG